MNRHLIEMHHTYEECQMLVDEIHARGDLHHFDWGCKSGVNSGWETIQAEDEESARLAVPPLVRHNARVIMAVKGEPSAARTLHPRMGENADGET